MPLLKWESEFEIGHPEIDADHRIMLGLINALHDDARGNGEEKADLDAILTRLIDHSHGHFEREEALMEAAGFDHDRLLEQRSEHSILRDQLLGIKSRLDLGDDAAAIALELKDFLLTWFYGHVLEEDMKFKPYLEGGA